MPGLTKELSTYRRHETTVERLSQRDSGLDLLPSVIQQAATATRAIGQAARQVAANLTNSTFYVTLGQSLLDSGRRDDALVNFKRAIQLDSDSVAAWIGLGETLLQLKREVEAEEAWLRILQLQPDHAPTHGRLGAFYRQRRQVELAFKHLRASAQLAQDAGDWLKLADFSWEQGNSGEALECFDRACSHETFDLQAEYLRGLIALARGDWADGWRRFEYRRLLRADMPSRGWPMPLWTGDAAQLAQQSIFVRSEGRLAEDILFAAWLPELIRRSAGVALECVKPLRGLFARSFPQAAISGGLRTQDHMPSPHFLTALGSLPKHLGMEACGMPSCATSPPPEESSVAEISSSPRDELRSVGPHGGGYLQADWKLARLWQRRLACLGANRKVGVVGLPATNGNDRDGMLRGVAAWWDVPGIEWLWLPADRKSPIPTSAVHHRRVHSFRDLPARDELDQWAALLTALDLVIAPAGVMAHLAAAVGTRTWILTPSLPAWYWGLHGETCRWYPTARLFRQQEPDNWSTVVAQVSAELEAISPSFASGPVRRPPALRPKNDNLIR